MLAIWILAFFAFIFSVFLTVITKDDMNSKQFLNAIVGFMSLFYGYFELFFGLKLSV